MRITVDIDANQLKEIQLATGQHKKSPAIRQALCYGGHHAGRTTRVAYHPYPEQHNSEPLEAVEVNAI